jgi:hypothetical protein
MIAESRIRAILADPFEHNGWTIQGLGMLRLELDEKDRLHIWDPRAALNEVSSVHDHLWDFTSFNYFGGMGNQRYVLDAADGVAMQMSRVQCGVGSHLLGEPRHVMVAEEGPQEEYGPGEQYSMKAEEFHESFPLSGTVTVIRRQLRRNRDIATVCWAGGGEWKQEGFTRHATRDEILRFVRQVRL